MGRGLFYLFVLASLAAAAWFALAADSAAKERAAGLFAFCLGGGMMSLSWNAIETGRIRGRRTYVQRQRDPMTFWSMAGLYLLLGAMLAAAAIWRLAD